MKKLLIAVFLILTVLLSSCAVKNGEVKDKSLTESVDKKTSETDEEKAPDFQLENIKGETIKLSDLQGKYVVINFFATWCPPCKAELPGFVSVAEKYSKTDKNIVFLFVDVNEESSKVEQFIKDRNYNTIIPLLDKDGEAFNSYTLRGGIPLTIIVDKSGSIKLRHEGLMYQNDLENAINDIIKPLEN